MTKQSQIIRRRQRVRLHLRSVSLRPRLTVIRSNAHIVASINDDTQNKTLLTLSDQKFEGTKTARATLVGTQIAALALKQGIKEVAFDRGSYRYHGRVKALAEAARQAGLSF